MNIPPVNDPAKAFMKRPKTLVCYICGREFGTTSLQIHQKQCAEKWEKQEAQKPKHLRKPLPQPPQDIQISSSGPKSMAEIEAHNAAASAAFEEKVMVQCEYCGRTFLPDRFPIHQRSCTSEKPAKPIPGFRKTIDVSNLNEQMHQMPQVKSENQAAKTMHIQNKMMNPKGVEEEKEGKNMKWKKQHEEFAQNINYAKKLKEIEEKGGDIREAGPPPKTDYSDYVQCPHCTRKFGKEQGEKHIPKCANIINKPKPPPTTPPNELQQPYQEMRNQRSATGIRQENMVKSARESNTAGNIGFQKLSKSPNPKEQSAKINQLRASQPTFKQGQFKSQNTQPKENQEQSGQQQTKSSQKIQFKSNSQKKTQQNQLAELDPEKAIYSSTQEIPQVNVRSPNEMTFGKETQNQSLKETEKIENELEQIPEKAQKKQIQLKSNTNYEWNFCPLDGEKFVEKAAFCHSCGKKRI